MHVSNIILIGLAIDESQIFIMREDKPSHPLDLFGSSALIMSIIFYSEMITKDRLSGVLN